MIDPKSFPGGDLKPNHAGLAAVCVGMPRTGLTSMRVALGQLLDGPCHHAADCFESGADDVLDFWMKGFEGKLKKQDFIDYFQGRGYRGAVDLPAMLFYRELMEAFPDCKFILSMRNPTTWFKSVATTIRLHMDLRERWPVKMLMYLSGQGKILEMMTAIDTVLNPEFKEFFDCVGKGTEEEAITYYHKWTERIKAEIPADKLLMFEPKDGWEPLCKFLGVKEVPSEPYPRVNDTKQMQDMVQMSVRFCNACYVGLPTLIAGAAALVYYWC